MTSKKTSPTAQSAETEPEPETGAGAGAQPQTPPEDRSPNLTEDQSEAIPHLGESLAQLDPELTNPTRLGLVSSLRNREKAEFKLLRDSLGVSDSVLSRHISALETAGLLEVKKGYVGKRPRTWVSTSAMGRRRFDAHVAALRKLAGS